MDLTPTIVPKSDQLNADDLISGPITITITDVRKGSAEQPVFIEYEGGTGRPYKPSKSMRRVLVMIWGRHAEAYLGQRLTLYRDPAVKFGGDPVGGIKISHASGIPASVSLMLTVTRGRREPHQVEPIGEAAGDNLGQLPPAWANWTTEERGDFMSSQGLPRLEAWWKTVPKGAEKKGLESRLRKDWKPAAEAVTPKS